MPSFERSRPDAGKAFQPIPWPPRSGASPAAREKGFEPEAWPPRPARAEPAPAEAPEPAAAPPAPPLEEQLAQAREEGRAEGRAELPWQEAEALGRAVAALEQAGAALGELRRGYLRSQRRALVELALAVAGRLVRRELSSDPEALAGAVERALEELDPDGEEPVSLHLAPAERTLLERDPAIWERLTGVHGLRVEEDERLEAGDVRLRAGRSQVDARVDELLRRVREALAELVDLPEEPT